MPTKHLLPIDTPPAMFTPGAIWLKSPILQSWSTVAEVLIIEKLPIDELAWITAFAKTAEPISKNE